MGRLKSLLSRARNLTPFLIFGLLIAVPLAKAQFLPAASIEEPGIGGGGAGPKSLQRTQTAIINDTQNGTVSLDTFIASCDTTVDGKLSSNGVLCNIFTGLIGMLGTTNNVVASTQADGSTKQVLVQSPGAIGSTTNLISQLYEHPPASSTEYIADLIDNMKHPFVPRAYAQGLGFSSLSPVLGLWKIFRNVSYLFFVVIFVVVGFLIMIRSKIGSQAAVTVQQVLPKLVISLILVTFSYAIVGLMIDIMYLAIFLLIGVIGGPAGTIAGGQTGTINLREISLSNDIFTSGFGLITNGAATNVAEGLNTVVSNILGNLGWNETISKVFSAGVGVVFLLIFIVAILYALFRVFMALIGAYVGIFFSVIFAPIQLMFGALPGQNTFQKWIQGILENLIVFPTIVLLILIAYFITALPGGADSTGFAAPQLGGGAGNTAFWQALIAFGAIMAMPEVIKVAKGIMKGEIDITGGQLFKNLAVGNQYAAPFVGGTLGGLYGAGAGAFAAQRQSGWDLRRILSGAIRGADYKGGTMGGVSRTVPQGFSRGQSVSGFIDRALEGKLLNPDVINRQLEALRKSTENKTKGGGTSGTSGGGAGTTTKSGGGGARAI